MLTRLKRERLVSALDRLAEREIVLPTPELIVAPPRGQSFPFQQANARGDHALLRVMAGAYSARPLVPFQGISSPDPSIVVPTYTGSVDVVRAAEIALGREEPLSEIQATAMIEAHLVGHGQLGKDEIHFACFGNFTKEHIVAKATILAKAGFKADEIDVLIRTGIAGASSEDAAHYAICTDLFNGKSVDAHPFHANGNHTQIFWTRIHHDHTGRSREALFKPRVPGDCDGYGRNTMEYVAYAVNRMLGMDLVPPVAYRRNFSCNGQDFAEGALIYLVPDAHLLKDVRWEEWGDDRDLFLSDARILDLLVQNPDRTATGFIRGRHWVDGRWRPMLIDHGAGMRANTVIRMDWNDALGGGKIKKVRQRTFEALKNSNYEWLKREIGEFVTHDELCLMLMVRDYAIDYFQNRINRHGWENVVVG